MWRLSLTPGAFKNVVDIVYGKSASGFESTTPIPLVKDAHYLVGINGAGIANSIEFVLHESGSKLTVEILGRGKIQPR